MSDGNDTTTPCDVCGAEHERESAPDISSTNLCGDCAWQEVHVVRREGLRGASLFRRR